MPIDQKGSAVIYSIDDSGVIRFGMVHDVFGYWTLAKGTIEADETSEQGTIRKVKEETNWDVEIMSALGNNEYIAYPPERGPVRKQVTYYLAKSDYTIPVLEKGSGGLDDVRWFELSEISDLNIYEDVSQMLIKSIALINGYDVEKETVDESVRETEPEIAKSINIPDLRFTELKALAKEREIEGYLTMKKAELIKVLSK